MIVRVGMEARGIECTLYKLLYYAEAGFELQHKV
jgi:hypothetical protein